MSELTENIKVFVRVRPSTSFERIVQVLSDTEIALISNSNYDSKYKFNAIFPDQIHQDEAYNVILVPIVRDFIQGYNCTLFSYGSTKNDAINTLANNSNLFSSTPNLHSVNSTQSKIQQTPTDDTMTALVSCAIYRLFEHLTQLELSSSVRISYLEIRDEELVDLMSPGNGTQLKIFENEKNQVFVNGLTETTVHSAAEAIMIFRMAHKNAHSIKPHSIFTISMQTKETPKFQMQENEGLFKYRKFCIVQLGSQDSLKKHARVKTVQSLTSLSRVVQALTNKQSHIPYRDSKLTRIMQESLGGNTKTAIVANIGASSNSTEETTQALEFLNRIKSICNHPKINERLDDSRTLNEMTLEIRKLMMDIEANRNKTGHFLTDEMHVNYQSELQTARNDARRNKNELKLVNETWLDLDSSFSNVNSNLNVKNKELTQLQSEMNTKQDHLRTISKVNNQRTVLIDHHSSTEKTLTEQATELTDTVKTVINDKKKLDDCVTRYKSTDDHLMQSVHAFHTEMQEKLSNLKRNSEIVSGLIENKLQKTGDLEKHMMRSAVSLTEILKKKSCLLIDQLEVNRTREANKLNDMKNEFDEVLQTRLKSIDLNITVYKEYARKFEQQSNTIEAFYQEIREVYENYFVEEDKMIADMKQRMKLHSDDISGQVKSLRLTLEECTEIGRKIDAKMNLIYTEMRDIVAQIQQNTINMKNTVEPALETAEKHIEKTRRDINKSFDDYESAIKEHQDSFVIPKLPDNFKSLQNDLKDVNAQTLTRTTDCLENVATNHTKSMECGLKHFETSSMDIPSKREILDVNGQIQNMKQQLSTNCDRAVEQNKENIDVINGLVLATEQMSTKTATEISSCTKHVTNFREKDFCEYKSSGETPSKCEYMSNVSLVPTTPLEKIKQRFRDRLSQINAASPNLEYSFLND